MNSNNALAKPDEPDFELADHATLERIVHGVAANNAPPEPPVSKEEVIERESAYDRLGVVRCPVCSGPMVPRICRRRGIYHHCLCYEQGRRR